MDDQIKNSYKTLLLVRHAKSSWDAGVATDFERPLNERGKKDAPEMAARLRDRSIIPDLLVSSPAKRAFTTALIFSGVFNKSPDRIISIPLLYHAAPQNFFEVISKLDNATNTVAIFSHNPGITAFVNMLTDTIQVDNMPTCSIFAVKVLAGNWADFEESSKEFVFFDYPKKA